MAPVQRANQLLPAGAAEAQFANWECQPRVPRGRIDYHASAMNWIATTAQAILSDICNAIRTCASNGETHLVIYLHKAQDEVSIGGFDSKHLKNPVCIETLSDLLESLGYGAHFSDFDPDLESEEDDSVWMRTPELESFDQFLVIRWADS